ncbi:hypothetical protein CANINC_001923 [Pichia inconspicua]|uniref:Mitochondrial distribution and morphology protein 31 n=1 Tax=Pichia inconspicua TaxID=52247 RepID=A0A4T0X2K7_9ASCO|nr:hypothetical protein CANINC_001923 [[Candida] inconspicua]
MLVSKSQFLRRNVLSLRTFSLNPHRTILTPRCMIHHELLKSYKRPRIPPTNWMRGPMVHQFQPFSGKRLSKMLENLENIWLKVKWVLIRSKRPLNWEDIMAFVSWLLTGNIMLFLIGTTTFFSLILMTVNNLTTRDFVTEWLGKQITKNSNLTVSFENAIVPDWKSGRIQFNNCLVSRRPKVVKFVELIEKDVNGTIIGKTKEEVYDDGNYTQFDLTIEEISISLSFWRWISGKGIVDKTAVKCMRGIVDRTHVVWKEGDDPRNYKNIYKPGDWEIESFEAEDVLITIFHPNGFRPCQLSIYNADLDVFRKNWLILDILTCNHMSGSYDGSLFTINKISNYDNFTEESEINSLVNKKLGREQFPPLPFFKNGEKNKDFKKLVRFRMDNLKVEHLNKGMDGPVGWITKGTVDVLADFCILQENITLDMLLDEGLNNFSNQFLFNKRQEKNDEVIENGDNEENNRNLFICDFYLRLKNPKAQVPLFAKDLSYINSAAIRPIVGYINNNKTFIPIRGRVYKNLNDFDGAWTFYDSTLMDDLSEAIYQSFYEYVVDEKLRNERLRKVGFWSLQFVLQFILWSMTIING